MNPPAANSRIAYMTGEYPRATDTFIQREISALRQLGLHVQTFAVREPAGTLITDEAQAAEHAGTHYLLPVNWLALLRSHATAFFGEPRRYFRAVKLAFATRAPGFARTLKQFAYFAEAGVLAEQMRRRKLPHLHNHFSNSSCSVAMLAAEMGGFTYSFTMHGPSEFFEPKVFAIAEKIRRAAFVACISHFCRSQAMVFVEPGQWEKLMIVHCGVEISPPRLAGEPARHVSSKMPRRAGSPAKQEKRRLLFVGRLAAVKGLPILLDAFVLVRREFQLELLLAGDGPDRAMLSARAQALGIADRVRFLGYQSPAQVQALLGEADVFVLPSFAEGVPVVLMEAMAAGVPVVATHVAGIPELVDHERTGLLVPPGDARLIAEQVARLLNDPMQCDRLTAAAKQKVAEEFNVHTEACRLFDLFCQQLNRKAVGSMTANEVNDLPRGLWMSRPFTDNLTFPNVPARRDRYVLITPCRDEARYARTTLQSVAAQTLLPALWVIVDDGSTDATPKILADFERRLPFLRIVRLADRGERKLGGGVIDAFYAGLKTIDLSQFDYLCKLDLDLDLPPRYFETLVRRMETDPRLGTCSGKPWFAVGMGPNGRRISEKCGSENSVGMSKFYRRECFEQIGGFVREVMWDGIDCHRCRMLGWKAASWDGPDLSFQHLRPMGTSHHSWWTGRVRHGRGQYFMGTSPVYMTASALFRTTRPPVLLGGAAMLWGYLRSAVRKEKRYGDEEFRRFLRGYQLRCLTHGKRRATIHLNESTLSRWRPARPAMPIPPVDQSIAPSKAA